MESDTKAKVKAEQSDRQSTLTSIEVAMRGLLERIDFSALSSPADCGRPRAISAALFWSAVLVAIVRGAESMRGIWRLISSTGLWDFDRKRVSDEAIYRRLKSDDWKTAENLFIKMQTVLPSPRPVVRRETWFAPGGVYAIDDSVLDQVAKKTESLRGKNSPELAGRIATVFDICSGRVVHAKVYENANENEKKHVRELLDALPSASMLVFDLGYFGFRWFDDLTDLGHFYVSRMRAGTSIGETIHTNHTSDCYVDRIVWLGKHRADRAKHAVRLVEVLIGKTWHRYLTNQLDARKLQVSDVIRLYAGRWDIELAFKLIKRVLGLSTIWSADFNVIRIQVFAILTVAWVVRACRSELAKAMKRDVDDISEELMLKVIPLVMSKGDVNAMPEFIRSEQKGLGLVCRPSRRIKYESPKGMTLSSPSENLILVRTPRYAGRI